ncbi:head maturation protease [Pseudomonas phage PhiPA3]|uniref:Virion structural protein n=1 Tax=Pseudomonas phage PhiPA3 TaxID=998086 RepID=F8SJ48_BPPA3|nr:head maturation protease [Pseudomonas phage PhiPA3]AEH03628.1 virion structural protein [Pseudomonas phage PhiPA3]
MQFGTQPQRANNVANQVRIGCTMLAGTDKKGILAPSADGYYTVVLGAYGTHNSAGMFYDEASGVSMFNPDSPLMRRLKKGVLFMEFKHPEPWEEILVEGRVVKRQLSDREYLQRIRKIDDDRVCAHIRALSIVDTINEEGRRVKMVVGEVKPYGPFGHIFKESLDNPSINTYCSVRSITQDDMMRGIKYTREISTWDFVGEGGIYIANKYKSPALESFAETEVVITPATLWGMQDQAMKQKSLGLESDANMDVSELIEQLGWTRKQPARIPHYMRKR